MNQSYYGFGLPVDISTHGWQIDRLIYILHGFMAVLFVGWTAFLIYAIFRFRQRPGHQATHQVGHFRLPTWVEIGVAAAELVFLTAFSFPLWSHVRNEFPPREKSVQVRVVAEQFAWNVHYPGRDRIFGRTDPGLMNPANPLGLDPADPAAQDDIATINQLHIPIRTPVWVDLFSKDVVHSFALPVMRVKQDVIPGQSIPVWFEAKRTGEFEIACAQLCGLGHYRMRGFFVVETQEQFDAWLAEQAGT